MEEHNRQFSAKFLLCNKAVVNQQLKTIVLLRQEREKPENIRCRAICISSREDLPDHCKELVETNYKKYCLTWLLKNILSIVF